MAKEKKRGVWLNIWLAIILIGNITSAAFYLFFSEALTAFYPEVPIGMFYIYGLLAIANLAFVAYLFLWKKWAFFGLLITAIIAFIMNISIGISFGNSLLGLLGIAILYLLLKPKWKLLE